MQHLTHTQRAVLFLGLCAVSVCLLFFAPYLVPDFTQSVEAASFGCEQQHSFPELDALTPAFPAYFCRRSAKNLLHPFAFQASGCLFPGYITFIVEHQGQATAPQSQAAFHALYAPIDTPAEALSYAIAITQFTQENRQIVLPGYRPFDQRTIPYQVSTEAADRYRAQIMVQDGPRCGCAKRSLQAVTYQITKNGQISIVEETLVATEEGCLD